MTFAIIKLSYNSIGDATVEGGVCGSGFFVDKKTFLTANHFLNSNSKIPNAGFKYCQFWLASRAGEIIEITDSIIEDFPSIDVSVIRFSNDITQDIVSLDVQTPCIGDLIKNQGYTIEMPIIDPFWNPDKLIIRSVDLTNNISDNNGYIKDFLKITIQANDVKIVDKYVIITSYLGRIGMSGGPLFNAHSKVIGLMSFGYPIDVITKDFLGAIWIDEIMKTI